MKTDATHKVTRLEIIDDGGRGYVNMRAGGIETSLQDDDRTMKIFTKGRSNASDERMFTDSEVRAMLNEIRNLADGYWNEAGHGAPDMLSPSEIDGISERGGIFLDPA